MKKNRPNQNPVRGRRSFVRLVVAIWRQMRAADIQFLAGSLAFTTLISLVPLLAVSLGVFSQYGGMQSVLNKIEPFLLHNLVDASGAGLGKEIRNSLDRVQSRTVGLTGAIGLLLTSTKLFNDVETAVQRLWQIQSRRWFVFRLIAYWILMFSGPFVVAFALGQIGSKDVRFMGSFSKHNVFLLLEFVTLLGVYKFAPACPVRFRSALISASLATGALKIAQLFYSQITRNILSYNKIYGSLASIPIFMLWVLVLWYICLIGVAFTAVLDHREAKPIG